MEKPKVKCPKCKRMNFWHTSDGRLKCKNCKYLFKPKPNPLNIPEEKLREIISEFLLERSLQDISAKVQISKYKLIKLFKILRKLMSSDIPEVIKKIIKIEPNSFEEMRLKRRPIIGIFSYEGVIFAKILPEFRPKEIREFIKNKEDEIFEGWEKNLGLIYRKNLYKLSSDEEINKNLNDFWNYLEEKFFRKGGIRKEKLPLFLGEYVWRYNHRNKNLKEKEERLFLLLKDFFENKNSGII